MYAVIVSGGKQYRVKVGDSLKVAKLNLDPGATLEFDQVLMVGEGDKLHIGAPYLSNCTVKATVVNHGRGEKIRIIKMKRRKHHMKRMGHRQDYTELKISGIAA